MATPPRVACPTGPRHAEVRTPFSAGPIVGQFTDPEGHLIGLASVS